MDIISQLYYGNQPKKKLTERDVINAVTNNSLEHQPKIKLVPAKQKYVPKQYERFIPTVTESPVIPTPPFEAVESDVTPTLQSELAKARLTRFIPTVKESPIVEQSGLIPMRQPIQEDMSADYYPVVGNEARQRYNPVVLPTTMDIKRKLNLEPSLVDSGTFNSNIAEMSNIKNQTSQYLKQLDVNDPHYKLVDKLTKPYKNFSYYDPRDGKTHSIPTAEQLYQEGKSGFMLSDELAQTNLGIASKESKPYWDNFINDLNEAGYNLRATGGYRPLQQQIGLKVKKPTAASTPGNSIHGYGNAFDLNTNDINKYLRDEEKQYKLKPNSLNIYNSKFGKTLTTIGAKYGIKNPEWAIPYSKGGRNFSKLSKKDIQYLKDVQHFTDEDIANLPNKVTPQEIWHWEFNKDWLPPTQLMATR